MTENNIKKSKTWVWQWLEKNKVAVSLMAIIILNILVSCFYMGYQLNFLAGDASTYFNAAKFLQGGQVMGPEIINRVLTVPLFLFFSISLDFFLKDLSLSISIVNVIFYALCVYTFYFLVLEIYKNNKVAILSTVLFSFNYYVIDPVNAHLSDMGGWLFFILGTYLAVRYFKTAGKKYYYLCILLSAIGVLFKEYGGFGIVSLALLILFSGISFKQKIKDIFVAGLLFILPLLSWHIFVYLEYHYTYLDWYLRVGARSSTPGYEAKGFILLIKIVGWLFTFGWLAFLWGLKEEFKVVDKNRIKILLAILPATLFFLVWPAITQRLGVMFMMWLALIAGFGLSKMKWYFLYPLLAVYIIFNYNIASLIKIINLPF